MGSNAVSTTTATALGECTSLCPFSLRKTRAAQKYLLHTKAAHTAALAGKCPQFCRLSCSDWVPHLKDTTEVVSDHLSLYLRLSCSHQYAELPSMLRPLLGSLIWGAPKCLLGVNSTSATTLAVTFRRSATLAFSLAGSSRLWCTKLSSGTNIMFAAINDVDGT